MRNIAVILAGGSGKRVGGDRPKQLLPLSDGRTILEHAVEAFRACDCIDDVVVVMHPDYLQEVSAILDCHLVAGGSERWESSWNAIQSLCQFGCLPVSDADSSDCNILLHDAARPFISAQIIENVCHALQNHQAVTVAVPATDTMYRVENGHLSEIPPRATMMRAQTPQAFRLSLIRHAYELALQDPDLQATDDCGIVHRYLPDVPVFIVPGEEKNRKITYKEDL